MAPKAKRQKFDEYDLSEIRKEISSSKEELNKLISHASKMLEYYSDWEDRLLTIEKKISQAEDDLGLTRQEIVEYDSLADAFN